MAYLKHNNIVEFSYMKQLIKRTTVCSFLLLISSHAYSAGLGKIHVKSALGESLVAEIDIIESQSEQTSSLAVRLGNSEEYAAAGLQDSILPSGVHAQIIRHADNSRVIQIVSDRAVNDPFIEMLVKVESPTVNILRQYTVLLDPPYSKLNDELSVSTKDELGSPLKVETSPKVTASKINDIAPNKRVRRAHNQKKEPSNLSNDEGIKSPELTENVYVTQSGDVFGKVAQQYQPAGVSLKKVMAAFYQANPDAFVNGDMNHLKAGQTLKIPKLDDLASNPVKDKKSEADSPTHKSKDPVSKSSSEESAQRASEDTTKFVLKVSPADAMSPPKSNQDKESVATSSTGGKDSSPSKTSTTDIASNLAPVPDAEQAGTAEPKPEESPRAAVPQDNNASSDPAPQPKATVEAKSDAKPIVIETNADQSFLNALLANIKWILIGMILPSIFFIAVLILNKRRMEQLRIIQDSFYQDVGAEIEPPPSSYAESKTLLDTAPAIQFLKGGKASEEALPLEDEVIKTLDSLQPLGEPTVNESLRSDAKDATKEETEIDIHEVDPLVEAEIYISYGRLEQAEGILKNALLNHPYKLELIMMLLKLYKDRNDKSAFEKLARDIYEATENGVLTDPVIWAKVALLGGKFDPTNILYQIEGVATDGHARGHDQDNLIFDDSFMDVPNDVSEIVSFEEQLPLDELTELPKGASNLDDLDDNLDSHLKGETITGLGLIEKESVGENLFDPGLIPQSASHDQNVIEFVLDDTVTPDKELAKNDKSSPVKDGLDADSLDDLFGEQPKP